MPVTNTVGDVRSYLVIKINNNPSGLIQELNNHGYAIDVATSAKELNRIMIEIYNTRPDVFFSILRNVSFNASANNFTTNPDFLSIIRQEYSGVIPGAANQRSTAEEIFTGVGDFLGGSSQTDKTITSTTTEKSNAPWVILGIAVAVVVLVIVYIRS